MLINKIAIYVSDWMKLYSKNRLCIVFKLLPYGPHAHTSFQTNYRYIWLWVYVSWANEIYGWCVVARLLPHGRAWSRLEKNEGGFAPVLCFAMNCVLFLFFLFFSSFLCRWMLDALKQFKFAVPFTQMMQQLLTDAEMHAALLRSQMSPHVALSANVSASFEWMVTVKEVTTLTQLHYLDRLDVSVWIKTPFWLLRALLIFHVTNQRAKSEKMTLITCQKNTTWKGYSIKNNLFLSHEKSDNPHYSC